MRKKRVLMVGECSFLPTGLARYNKEVLMRLHASNQYEIAELAFYNEPDDVRLNSVPWKIYSNKPSQHDASGMQEYNSNLLNQFGKFRFDDVVSDFRPDVILAAADYWYFEWVESSPHRRFYKLIVMPTVDSVPQHESWLACYRNCDVVIPYTKFAQQALSGLNNVHGAVSYAGVENDIFVPMNVSEIRNEFGIKDDAIIIGTTMRNQMRKLYPELMEAFVKYLRVGPKELTSKSFLYIHSTYPDLGWDFPHLIKKYNLSSKTLFTYSCRGCGAVFPCFFRDIRTNCEKCQKPTAYFPSTQHGVSRESLAKIMNTFDVYIQYANSEGLGLPQIEAASCGIPVFATDYSAMSEVSRMLGYPIKVNHRKMDADWNTERAWPDVDDFIQKLINYLNKPKFEKRRLSQKYRENVISHFDWDKTARVWMDAIDGLSLTGHSYDESPALHEPVMPDRKFDDNADFVRWCIVNILGQPHLVDGYMSMRMVRDLNAGCTPSGVNGSSYHNENSGLGLNNNHESFSPEILINKLIETRREINKAEMKRYATTNKSRLKASPAIARIA